MKRRIAILEKTKTPYRPPVFNSIGETHEVTVFYANASESHREWDTSHEFRNFTETSISAIRIGPLVFPSPSFLHQLIRDDFDEFIANSSSAVILCSVLMAVAAKITGSTFTMWTERINTDWADSKRGSRFQQITRRFWVTFHESVRYKLYQLVDRVAAFSNLAADAAAQNDVDHECIKTAPQALPRQIMADPDHGSIPPTDKFRIVSICYLTGRKGVDILIDSIKEINADLELLVAGKGPQSPELHRLAKDDDRIKFLGYVSEGKKTALLESADLFVLPSRHEPWGLVVNEALNCGTPVITTSTAGAEMILNNRHVVPPADVDALCQAISAEMKTPSSPPTPPSVEDMACILK